MVQWLKRSPKTREVVSSSLNSDCFFLFVFFNFIACIDVELSKDRKVSFICYKMSFRVVVFFAFVYSTVFFCCFCCFFFFVLYVLYYIYLAISSQY